MKKIENNLYLGDVDDLKTIQEKAENTASDPVNDIDVILNVSGFSPNRTSMQIYTWINIPLKDGEDNQHSFNVAVENAIKQIKNDKKLLINCAAGISRSSGVMATALSVIENQSFKESLDQIKDKKPDVNPNPGIVSHAERFLEQSKFNTAKENYGRKPAKK